MLVTDAQVKDVTGVADVSDDAIRRAQFVIDLIADADLDDPDVLDRMKPRDRTLLRRAVCYQAPWQAAQVAFEENTDVVKIAGATSTGGIELLDEIAGYLAPLARACLVRLSWKRKRSMRDPTRAAKRLGTYGMSWAGVTVSRDPMDTPSELANALTDAGPYWGEPT